MWLTYYPNTSSTSNELWANVGGCFVLGFLQEDSALFTKDREEELMKWRMSGMQTGSDTEQSKGEINPIELEKERRDMQNEHLRFKKTIPLYIGLSVGFCGSFTSFPSFMRDSYLALSNNLIGSNSIQIGRNAGWSVCAVLDLMFMEVGLSLAALFTGAHVSEASIYVLARVPKIGVSRFLNPIGVFLAFGGWLGALALAIWPPHEQWQW
jgi:fluoride exporter